MKNKLKKITLADVILVCVTVFWGLLIAYPFYNSILVSIMTQAEFMSKPFALFVENPSIASYREIFSNDKFFLGYRATLSILAVKLPLSVLITAMMGYALSRKNVPFGKLVNNLTVFTMYFGGGIIPLYLLMKSYGLLNSWWSIIITGSFSVYNMILIKNFFYSIPDSLEESAKLDGANDVRIFFQIYIPLAKPIIATVALFVAVGVWNEWYTAMVFISNARKWPLQLVLREVINNVTATDAQKELVGEVGQASETFALNVQMAAVVVTMLPIMLVYPFLQKYFMKGIMVGAVKG